MARTIFIHKGSSLKAMLRKGTKTWASKSCVSFCCPGCDKCTDTCWPHFGCIHDVSAHCMTLPAVPLPSCRFM